MALATENTGRSRTRLEALPAPGHSASRVEIVENPIVGQDPALGAEVEAQVRRALLHEDLGPVQVRFRVCREEAEGLRFICKVENPPAHDMDSQARTQWRWWSPLMETLQDFRSALQEAVQLRRERLGSPVSAAF